MALDSEALYLQLGQLVAEMPVLGGASPITAETNRWLGRAAHLIEATGNSTDLRNIRIASDSLNTRLRESHAQSIAAIVYRALAYAEANAPAAARGAFIAVGAAFDAFQAIGKVLSEAKRDVMIVDPYMDSKVVTDFAPLAAEGIAISLLTDSFYTEPDALLPAANRWVQQFGTTRPLEVRMSAPRAVHDRLIVIDGAAVWSLTQSLKDFARRSPASVLRVEPELAKMKADFYAQAWSAARKHPSEPSAQKS